MKHKLFKTVLIAFFSFATLSSAYAQDAAKTAAAPAKTDAAQAAPAKTDAAQAAPAKNDVAKAAAANGDKSKAAKAAGVSAEARQYVDAIQAYYDAAKTYSASFTQDYITVDGVKKPSSGVVWFKKPGMMRWDYEKPEARFLISDGAFFWSWEPVYRQYCKQELKASQLPTALTFLSGQGKIEDDFNVELEKVDGQRVSLRLTPKKSSLSYSKILFEILMPSAKVYRVTIFDAMGNSNKITFKSPEINANLDDASFKFVPPADASHLCE